jgi:hypothetical protein
MGARTISIVVRQIKDLQMQYNMMMLEEVPTLIIIKEVSNNPLLPLIAILQTSPQLWLVRDKFQLLPKEIFQQMHKPNHLP